MRNSVFIGIISALVMAIPGILQQFESERIIIFPFSSPYWVLVITAFVVILQRSVFERRGGWRVNGGLADLLVHIHTPSSLDTTLRWLIKGCLSGFLAIFGGFVGMEGAAIELSHAFAIQSRGRFLRWFEQRRRTDAACVIASGIAAAFDAPFAGVLLPIELRIGGQNISAAMSAIAALLTIRTLGNFIPMKRFDLGGVLYGVSINEWKEWCGIFIIAVVTAFFSLGFMAFHRYIQEGLANLFKKRIPFRTITAGVSIFAIAFLYQRSLLPHSALLEQILWAKKEPVEVSLLFFSKFLCLALVLSTFGSVGIFWPVFALGGFIGFAVNYFVLGAQSGFAAAAAIVGGASFFSAALGAPVSAGVLSFELTQNLQVFFPCLVAGFLAREIATRLSRRVFLAKDFQTYGLQVVEGRSSEVLKSIAVCDAMVTDFEPIKEQESVAGLKDLLIKSKYPFLPVIRSDRTFVGLLTIDMVHESHSGAKVEFSHSSLSSLLEVKDLIYRYGFKTPFLKPTDLLSASTGLFEKFPCIPILSDNNHIIGLLFSANVRLAYDREVARRSLLGRY